MEKFIIRDRIKNVFIILVFLLLAAALIYLLTSGIIHRVYSVEGAIRHQNIKKENLIGTYDGEDCLFILSRKKDDLIDCKFEKVKKGHKMYYEYVGEQTTENVFNGEFENASLELLEMALQASSKMAIMSMNERRYFMLSNPVNITTLKEYTHLKINGKSANDVITYKTNDKVYYFLIFENIKLKSKIKVTLE